MITQMFVLGDQIWFPTTKGRVYRSSDSGASWQVFPTPLLNNGIFASIAFHDSLNGMAVARATPWDHSADKGVYTTSDGGQTWSLVATGNTGGVEMKNHISVIPAEIPVYVVTGSEAQPYGSAYTTDMGKTWVNIDDVKHYRVYFLNEEIGFSGSFSDNTGNLGVFKWNGEINVSIQPLSSVKNLKLYPNPASDFVTVDNNYSGESDIQLEVYDLNGKLVINKYLTSEAQHKVNLHQLRNGIYTTVLKGKNSISIQKLVVNH